MYKRDYLTMQSSWFPQLNSEDEFSDTDAQCAFLQARRALEWILIPGALEAV